MSIACDVRRKRRISELKDSGLLNQTLVKINVGNSMNCFSYWGLQNSLKITRWIGRPFVLELFKDHRKSMETKFLKHIEKNKCLRWLKIIFFTYFLAVNENWSKNIEATLYFCFDFHCDIRSRKAFLHIFRTGSYPFGSCVWEKFWKWLLKFWEISNN